MSAGGFRIKFQATTYPPPPSPLISSFSPSWSLISLFLSSLSKINRWYVRHIPVRVPPMSQPLCPITTVGCSSSTLLPHLSSCLPRHLPQIFPNQTFQSRWHGRTTTVALSAQAMRRARRRPRHCPGRGRFLLVPSWRHDLYWFLCRDYFFVVVTNDRLSICPPWLAEGGLITKALGGAPDSWEIRFRCQTWSVLKLQHLTRCKTLTL